MQIIKGAGGEITKRSFSLEEQRKSVKVTAFWKQTIFAVPSIVCKYLLIVIVAVVVVLLLLIVLGVLSFP